MVKTKHFLKLYRPKNVHPAMAGRPSNIHGSGGFFQMKLLTGLVIAGAIGLMGLAGCQNMPAQQTGRNAGRGQFGQANAWGQFGQRGQQAPARPESKPVKITMADGSKIEVLSFGAQEKIANHTYVNARTANGPIQIRIEHIATVEGGDLKALLSGRGAQPQQQQRSPAGRGGPQTESRGGNDEGPGWGGRGGGFGRGMGGGGMMGGRGGMGPMGGRGGEEMRGGPMGGMRNRAETKPSTTKEAPKKEEPKKSTTTPKA
jgi:hypothetical protein